ncbi:MAG: hypothetical protein R2747_04545 [Pyrinomonadaceae bacterium]
MKDIWTFFVAAAALQTVFALLSGPATNAFLSLLIRKIKSVWVYALGVLAGVFIHFVLLFLFLIPVFLIFGSDSGIVWGGFLSLLTIFSASLISSLCIGFGRGQLSD